MTFLFPDRAARTIRSLPLISVLSWRFIAPLVFLVPSVRADIVINGQGITVSTGSTKVAFQGMSIQSLTNILTNEQNIAQPGAGWMDLSMQKPTGQPLNMGTWMMHHDSNGAEEGVITANDPVRTVITTLAADPDTNEIILRFQGRSNQPGLRSLFFGLQGFDPRKGRFLLPAHAGIYFDQNTTPPLLSMEYPTHWEAQFVIYETSEGGVLIYARDPRPYFKRVQATRQYGTLDLGLEVFALGPWSSATDTPPVEWRIRAFKGSWRTAVDVYRNWSDTVLPKRGSSPHPAWAKNIKAVVTIIDTVSDYIDELAKRLDPAKTLLYLVNWRSDSYDVNYPNYTPGPNTAAFVQRAHQRGFRVMLHTNALGVATYNSVYKSVAQYQLRDPDSGNVLYWPQGLWPAGPPPPFFIESFAFISAASSMYRSTFIDALRPAVEALKPDALHLDAGGVMLDDGNGLIEGKTSIEGMFRLHEDVAAAFPEVALSYESMTDVLAGLQDFAQRWNADYPAHPISTYLMGDRVTFYGFLDQPPPDEPGFIDYIKRYERQGVMPTIPVNTINDIKSPSPIAFKVLQMMSLWQKYDFRPDWSGDWTGLGFRYVSADGSTNALLKDDGKLAQLDAANRTIYERLHDVDSYKSSSFIANWTAFDGTSLYGLNPDTQYWLRQDISRPAKMPHLTELPTNVSLGAGTLATSKYGYFELNNQAGAPYDLIQEFFSAKAGTDYLRKDYPIGAGDLIQITRTSIAGQALGPVILMQPPTRLLGAAVFLDYQIPVPAAGSTSLNFSAGLSDFGNLSDGATFLVRINGSDEWKNTIKLGTLMPGHVDLSQWAGQTIDLRFIVHPGPALNPIDDLACWANLRITTTPPGTASSFDVVPPNGTSEPLSSGTLQLSSVSSAQGYPAQSDLPGKFAIFAKAPVPIKIGQSLLDIPFDVWKMGYGGWPFPFAVGSSGTIERIVSGGQAEARALSTLPPANGLSIVTWAAQLPKNASALDFKAALADPLPPLPPKVSYSQTGLSVKINGETIWSETIQINGWVSHRVDISKWAGQNVVVQIAADALGQGTFNWIYWAGLTVQ